MKVNVVKIKPMTMNISRPIKLGVELDHRNKFRIRFIATNLDLWLS